MVLIQRSSVKWMICLLSFRWTWVSVGYVVYIGSDLFSLRNDWFCLAIIMPHGDDDGDSDGDLMTAAVTFERRRRWRRLNSDGDLTATVTFCWKRRWRRISGDGDYFIVMATITNWRRLGSDGDFLMVTATVTAGGDGDFRSTVTATWWWRRLDGDLTVTSWIFNYLIKSWIIN